MKVTGTPATPVGCFSPLPIFLIEGNFKFHSDMSKDENSSFPIQLCGPLVSPLMDAVETEEHTVRSQNSTNTGSCPAL